MPKLKKYLFVTVFLILCFFQAGCAILNTPAKIVGGTFGVLNSIVKGIFKVAEKVPMPPPGVF